MPTMISLAKKVLMSTVAVGALTFGTVGASGAAATTHTPAQLAKGLAQAEKHFNCSTAARRLGYVQRLEARYAKRNARLAALEANAKKANDTKRAAYLQKVIDHQKKIQSHMLGTRMMARQAKLAKVAKLAQAKCHIAPPTSTTSTTA